LREFRGAYLETAKRLKAQQDKENTSPEVQQLDFEFVLFASALVDYDYIMGLIAKYTQNKPSKQTMSRQQLINMLSAHANLMDERDNIVAYINSLQVGKSLTEQEIRAGFQAFKAEKLAAELADIAQKHGLETEALQTFVNGIINRMIFDGEQLSDLLAPLELGWKARTQKELALMEDLVPHLKKLAQGHEISGLKAYE
jgi:type I restriction enzyme R subunit